MKKLHWIAIFVLVLTLLVACGTVSQPQSNNPNTVKMDDGSFTVPSITIKKGSTITFLNGAAHALHILTIGKGGQNEAENGAPDFGGLAGHRADVGDNWTTPPWNVAGTFHVTCTIHPAMNLTVTVTG